MPKMQKQNENNSENKKSLRVLQPYFFTQAEENFYEIHKRHGIIQTKKEDIDQWLCRICGERFDI